jgi:hypothetical protein
MKMTGRRSPQQIKPTVRTKPAAFRFPSQAGIRRGCRSLISHLRSSSCGVVEHAMQTSKIFHQVKCALLSDREKVGTIRLGVFRGVKTIASPSMSVQIRLGLWEQETYRYVRRAAHEASWVIDIGAGSGELSIFFDSRTKAEPIIAVEAWDARLLRRNIN